MGLHYMVFCVLVCKGKYFLCVLIASVTCLHFNMQEEEMLESINGHCHLCTL